jgi:hypothetical protein
MKQQQLAPNQQVKEWLGLQSTESLNGIAFFIWTVLMERGHKEEEEFLHLTNKEKEND